MIMTKPHHFSIGNSDFKDVIQGGSTYVDQTLFIKALMEEHTEVS